MSKINREEYKPGMTELRLNAKSNLVNLTQIFKLIESQVIELQEIRDQLAVVQQKSQQLTIEIGQLKAKLYENGIR